MNDATKNKRNILALHCLLCKEHKNWEETFTKKCSSSFSLRSETSPALSAGLGERCFAEIHNQLVDETICNTLQASQFLIMLQSIKVKSRWKHNLISDR